MALSHCVWTIYTSYSSEAWEDVTELMVLAINSPSESSLKNTSGGTSTIMTWKKKMAVRVDSNSGLGTEKEKLQAIFGDEKKVEPNVEY
ncbi:unnamed protein product [Clonostachys byssicola]|uniref:Uncharacterized protein n=1 Tax=Clonostachys byssicola TaxID=160290 RepID=A0A9N9UK22_9HYPO|nr:unnamed protein product [Clonostachys byssicola]